MFLTQLNEVPSPTNPLGIKVGGEGGTTGALAAVVNAVGAPRPTGMGPANADNTASGMASNPPNERPFIEEYFMTVDLQLINFPGAPNLPIFIAQEKGFFEDAGVAPVLNTTPSSTYQIEHLMNGNTRSLAPPSTTSSPIQKAKAPWRLTKRQTSSLSWGDTARTHSWSHHTSRVSPTLRAKRLSLTRWRRGSPLFYTECSTTPVFPDDVTMVEVGATPDRGTVRPGNTRAR